MMEKREQEEQRIINQYKSDMREHESKLDELQKRCKELEEKEQDITNFKQELFMFLNDEVEFMGQSKRAQFYASVWDELTGNFYQAEQEMEMQKEELNKERRQMFAREEQRTEEYYNQMKGLG